MTSGSVAAVEMFGDQLEAAVGHFLEKVLSIKDLESLRWFLQAWVDMKKYAPEFIEKL